MPVMYYMSPVVYYTYTVTYDMSACICNSHRFFFLARSLPWADKWRVVALLREGLSGGGGASMAAAAEAAAMADQSACMRCIYACIYI